MRYVGIMTMVTFNKYLHLFHWKRFYWIIGFVSLLMDILFVKLWNKFCYMHVKNILLWYLKVAVKSVCRVNNHISFSSQIACFNLFSTKKNQFFLESCNWVCELIWTQPNYFCSYSYLYVHNGFVWEKNWLKKFQKPFIVENLSNSFTEIISDLSFIWIYSLKIDT